MIFLDTNILVDVLEDADTTDGRWSRRNVAAAALSDPLVSNLIVFAELSGQLADAPRLADTLAAAEIALLDLDIATAQRAGTAFVEYRRRGGPRTTILPDFIIGAHAATVGARLMTRDRRLSSYFPELVLITPDTAHG